MLYFICIGTNSFRKTYYKRAHSIFRFKWKLLCSMINQREIRTKSKKRKHHCLFRSRAWKKKQTNYSSALNHLKKGKQKHRAEFLKWFDLFGNNSGSPFVYYWNIGLVIYDVAKPNLQNRWCFPITLKICLGYALKLADHRGSWRLRCKYLIYLSRLTCFPSHLLYSFHSSNPGRQYSNVYSSVYSWPLPRSYLPCVCTPVMTYTAPKSTWRNSLVPLSICCLGHQPPPAFSTRNLKWNQFEFLYFSGDICTKYTDAEVLYWLNFWMCVLFPFDSIYILQW